MVKITAQLIRIGGTSRGCVIQKKLVNQLGIEIGDWIEVDFRKIELNKKEEVDNNGSN